jgi:hypothetical protein
MGSYNAVKKNMPMTNRKNGGYTTDFKIKEVKAVAKAK